MENLSFSDHFQGQLILLAFRTMVAEIQMGFLVESMYAKSFFCHCIQVFEGGIERYRFLETRKTT